MGALLDCKTVRIFAYSSTRGSQTKGLERGSKQRARLGRDAKNTGKKIWKTYSRFFFSGRVRLARVRLLRHTLPISLLILRKKPTVLQSRAL